MVDKFKRAGDMVIRTKVRSFLAIVITLWVCLYLWFYTFTPSKDMNVDAKFIAGFVTGTMVATIINFYFGGSEKTKKETEDKDVEEI